METSLRDAPQLAGEVLGGESAAVSAVDARVGAWRRPAALAIPIFRTSHGQCERLKAGPRGVSRPRPPSRPPEHRVKPRAEEPKRLREVEEGQVGLDFVHEVEGERAGLLAEFGRRERSSADFGAHFPLKWSRIISWNSLRAAFPIRTSSQRGFLGLSWTQSC